MLYPFRCKSIYKEKVWGGRWFENAFGRKLPESSPIGESWELACRPQEMSEIVDGAFAGKSFLEIMQQYPVELLGKRIAQNGYDPFPLLIKFLDANEHLSVQVHPDDEFAQKIRPGELGKTEMWYILDAEPDGKLIMGVKEGVTPADFQKGIEDGTLEEYLAEVPVKAGDAFLIPAGTVHAIMKGVRLAEIQQNSDTTYRVYDWNRLGLDGKPRELHIKEALEVIDFKRTGINPHPGIIFEEDGWKSRLITACPYFAVEELEVEHLVCQINPERFEIWMVLEGNGTLNTKTDNYQLTVGETWVIPAALGDVELKGNIKILKSYIPDLQKEVITPLLAKGYTKEDLSKVGGLENLV
ncbi:MAG: class I mannose-6-phosphate isomerase [Halanaerobiales bacterium]|nr:class I mannose-6-phosphate isomerase [Halanaerobiales bacterium]